MSTQEIFKPGLKIERVSASETQNGLWCYWRGAGLLNALPVVLLDSLGITRKSTTLLQELTGTATFHGSARQRGTEVCLLQGRDLVLVGV